MACGRLWRAGRKHGGKFSTSYPQRTTYQRTQCNIRKTGCQEKNEHDEKKHGIFPSSGSRTATDQKSLDNTTAHRYILGLSLKSLQFS
jgi:hypothetical protein